MKRTIFPSASPQRARPLSPHLQIYRIQLTSLLSITHRATGIFLFAAAFLWCFYLLLWPSGKGAFLLQIELVRWSGLFFLFCFMFALFYHLLNGVRHLMWDVGVGFELRAVYQSGWIVVLGTCILTGISWWLLL